MDSLTAGVQLMFETRCPNPACRETIQVDDTKLGERMRCKTCGKLFRMSAKSVSLASGETRADSKTTEFRDEAADGATHCIGRFQIRRRLGSGAFGTVYLAHDPQLDRAVAIKILHSERTSSSKAVQRFLREAKAAARLQHPQIVPVFDAGKQGETYYIATGFVEGETLQDHLDKRRIRPKRAARITMQLAEALGYAHARRIVHRDVKPANIMIDDAGWPHLMDFGLARLESTTELLSHDGAVFGTPAYMPPEQARGDHRRVSSASDQYSLGATLYEMLCGQLPFSGPTEIVIYNVINQEPPSVRSVNSKVPGDLQTICSKAMAKDPAARYGSCVELADDLRRFLKHEPIAARPVGPLGRVMRWGRRHAVVAGLSMLLTLSLVVGLAVTAILLMGGRQREEQAKQLGNYEHQLLQAAGLISTDRQLACELLEDEDECPPHLREFTWHLMRRAVDPPKIVLKTDTVKGGNVFYDHLIVLPDRKRLLAQFGPSVTVWDLPTQKELYSQDMGSIIVPSPDGMTLAAVRYQDFALWDVETGKIRTKLGQTRSRSEKTIAFSPDSKQVAAEFEGTIRLFDSETGKIVQTFETDASQTQQTVRSIAFSPDGSLLAAVTAKGRAAIGRVLLWHTNSGVDLSSSLPELGFGSAIAFYPPTGSLAVADFISGEILLLSLKLSGTNISVKESNRFPAGHSKPVDSIRVFAERGILVTEARNEVRVHKLLRPNHKVMDINCPLRSTRVIAYSGDGRLMATINAEPKKLNQDDPENDEVALWDLVLQRRLGAISVPFARSVAILPEYCALLTSGGGYLPRGPKLWDINSVTMQPLPLVGIEDPLRYWNSIEDDLLRPSRANWFQANDDLSDPLERKHRYRIECAALSPDKQTLATIRIENGYRAREPIFHEFLELLEADSGKVRRTLLDDEIVLSTRKVDCLAWSSDGDLLASAGENGKIMIWDPDSGELQATLAGHVGNVNSLAFHPLGRTLVSAGSDKTIRFWHVPTGHVLLSLEPGQSVSHIAFSKDGKTLFSLDGAHPPGPSFRHKRVFRPIVRAWRTSKAFEL